jgi:hypothetical protein
MKGFFAAILDVLDPDRHDRERRQRLLDEYEAAVDLYCAEAAEFLQRSRQAEAEMSAKLNSA